MGDSCLPVTVVGPESTVRLEGESAATLTGPGSTVHLCLTPTDLFVPSLLLINDTDYLLINDTDRLKVD